jgi:long-subunit acyl-CoA synthetase (AMP-forming)
VIQQQNLSKISLILSGDLKTFHPTILTGVPRVWETIKKGIYNKISHAGEFKKLIFDFAFSKKMPKVLHEEKSPIWDFLVFKKFLPGILKLIFRGWWEVKINDKWRYSNF